MNTHSDIPDHSNDHIEAIETAVEIVTENETCTGYDGPAEIALPNQKEWRAFIILFVKSESLASLCGGYLLLLTVLICWELPWIGLALSLAVESIAAGYYLKVMQDEIHGESERSHLALWPTLHGGNILQLLRLGVLTNVIQIAYGAIAVLPTLPVLAAFYLASTNGGHIVSLVELTSMTFYAALFTSPFSLWVLVLMSPIGLAKFAHTGALKDAFDFGFSYKNIAWGSKLIKGAAVIYLAAIVANSTMMAYSPGLMTIFEPFIEFSSMAMVCRLNARWYRNAILKANPVDSDKT